MDDERAAPALRRRAALRFVLFLALLVGAFAAARWTPLAGYLDRQALAAALDTLAGRWWAPAVLVGLYVLLCPLGLPATPLIFAGGAVFGAGWGALWNLVGTSLSAGVGYALARGLGRDFVSHLLRGRGLRQLERRLARQDFWTLVSLRFVPLPFPLVNFGAALAGVPAPRFLLATVVGLLPATALYTYFAAGVLQVAAGRAGIDRAVGPGLALVALFALSLLPRWWNTRRRKRRYEELTARRRERG